MPRDTNHTACSQDDAMHISLSFIAAQTAPGCIASHLELSRALEHKASIADPHRAAILRTVAATIDDYVDILSAMYFGPRSAA